MLNPKQLSVILNNSRHEAAWRLCPTLKGAIIAEKLLEHMNSRPIGAIQKHNALDVLQALDKLKILAGVEL